MTSASARRTDAELQKLAKTLDTDVARLGFLETVPADDLAALRGQVADSLFRADKHLFARVAALSKSVPTSVAAKLTEAVLPPLLAARTTELLDPAKAAELVGKLSDSYLADVAAVMDASRAPDVVAAIPTAQVVAVSRELARRGEWVVIGGFVSHISADGLSASISAYTGEQLLHIAFVMDDPERLDAVVALLSDEQVDALLAAASDGTLWAEVATLLDALSSAQLERIAARYAAAPDALRERLDAAAASSEPATAALARLRAPA